MYCSGMIGELVISTALCVQRAVKYVTAGRPCCTSVTWRFRSHPAGSGSDEGKQWNRTRVKTNSSSIQLGGTAIYTIYYYVNSAN